MRTLATQGRPDEGDAERGYGTRVFAQGSQRDRESQGELFRGNQGCCLGLDRLLQAVLQGGAPSELTSPGSAPPHATRGKCLLVPPYSPALPNAAEQGGGIFPALWFPVGAGTFPSAWGTSRWNTQFVTDGAGGEKWTAGARAGAHLICKCI